MMAVGLSDSSVMMILCFVSVICVVWLCYRIESRIYEFIDSIDVEELDESDPIARTYKDTHECLKEIKNISVNRIKKDNEMIDLAQETLEIVSEFLEKVDGVKVESASEDDLK